ncbi:hypothetical protein I203_106398 [Kwoniella mangroviensis CBS 8507]|uniref:uncharacterized protein n=1 Tax=Kwoniella mangroviensis CBS 8507 TaxID=1296122 RepID=UPI00080D0544|nr:uncharacterized protein I203_07674 [Kwoniella mangroviensis CBS 8507]OCF63249.1 hypothetical protein I203_07674 [Kwoniella mangroviensis CBS 8507]
MESYTMNAQAGPSSPSSRFTLGPIISPTTKMIPLTEQEIDLDHNESTPTTPRPFNTSLPVTPPRPARSPRRSIDCSHHRPSISSVHSGMVTYDWTPLRIQPSHSRASSSLRSSISSTHPVPGDENRCRVSFDATPVPPSISEFSVTTQTPTSSRVSLGQPTPAQMEAVFDDRRKNVKKARFLEAPLMTRLDLGTSSDTAYTHRSYLSAFTGEDDPDMYAEEFRVPVDEAIRSVPGVVGLGEGWAGGPQKREKKKWFQRRQTVEEDPLSLWKGNEQKTTSPIRGIWSRSKKNLFGQSSPALLSEQQHDTQPPRSSTVLGKLFSLSRSNLASPDSSQHANPNKSKSKRFSLGIISSSEVTLQQDPTIAIHPSPSMPALSLTAPSDSNPQRHRQKQYSQSSLARSEGDLTMPSQIPSRSSSLRKQGLPPPWRPSSMILTNGGQRNSMLLVPPERDGNATSDSTTSLETPATCLSSTSSLSRGHALTRTATFGLDDIAVEQRIDEENNISEEESDNDWEHVRRESSTPNANELEKDKELPRIPSPQRRPSLKQRRTTWLKRMKNVLTSSNTRDSSSTSIGQTVDRLLARRKSSNARNSTVDLDSSVNSAEPTMEPLKTSPLAPRRKASRSKHRRNSWMIRSSSSLAKRLSRLTEHEEGITGHENVGHDEEIDIEDVDHANRLASPLGFASFEPSEVRKDRRKTSKKMDLSERRRSSNFSLLAVKSRRSSSVHPLDEIDRFPGSISMPALSKLTTTDLNLRVSLDGEELGLEDILDEQRRGSIVQSIRSGTPIPSLTLTPREQAIENTLETLSRKSNSIKIQRSPSPNPSYRSKMKARHTSLPLNTTHVSDINVDKRHAGGKSHKRSTTVSTMDSAHSANLITPRHPNELATFMDALTLISPSTPVEEEPIVTETEETLGLGGLTVPGNEKRSSINTHRFSGESYLTQPSLYDTEEVVQGHAIRVDSIEDMQRQASVVSLTDIGRNWSTGLQMSKA